MKILFLTYGAAFHRVTRLVADMGDIEVLMMEKFKDRFKEEYKRHLSDIQFVYADSLIDYYRKAKKVQADVIVSNCGISNFVGYLVKGRRKLYNIMGSDFITSYRNSDVNFFVKYAKLLVLWLMLRISYRDTIVIPPVRYLAKRAKEWGAKKIEIIGIYGVDMTHFSPKNKDRGLKKRLGLEGKKIVLIASRLTPEKGVEYMIKAMPFVNKEVGDAILVIAGSENDEEERKLREISSGNVEFIGAIEHEKMPYYFNIADVVVLPSLIEGIAVSSNEALSCERPVVATRVGGLPETVIDGKTGLLVEPKDVIGLGKAVVRILKDRKLGERFGREGRKHVKSFADVNLLRRKLRKVLKV